MSAVKEQELKTVQAELNKQPKYKINIQSTQTDSSVVELTLNGYRYEIMRDHDVVVPQSVKEVLDNAVVDGMRYDEAQGKNVPHVYKRYNFSSSPVLPAQQGK